MKTHNGKNYVTLHDLRINEQMTCFQVDHLTTNCWSQWAKMSFMSEISILPSGIINPVCY